MGDARAYMLARFASMSVFGVGLLAGLELTGLNLNTLAIIAGTLGVGVGFGLQSIVANWVRVSSCSLNSRSALET